MEARLKRPSEPPKKRQRMTYADRGRDASLKVSFYESEPLGPSSIQDKYHVSMGHRLKIDLTHLMTSNSRDPAFKVSPSILPQIIYYHDTLSTKYFRIPCELAS